MVTKNEHPDGCPHEFHVVIEEDGEYVRCKKCKKFLTDENGYALQPDETDVID